jgi:activating signal cointegrator complex subunit 1
MNDDPNSVDVLYAKVSATDGTSRLQTFVDGIVERFTSAGLMSRQYDRVKLHITVINSLMRGTSEKQRQSFDAANIFWLYRDFEFGNFQLESLHLSQRTSSLPSAYYDCAASVQLPQN